jgi:lipopolysaccharide O-acetyltransferase
VQRLIVTYGIYGWIRLAFSWLATKLFYPQARLIRLPIYIRGRAAISWGEGFTTGVGVRLDAFGQDKEKLLVIGERVQINDYVHIGAIAQVSIGNDVLIASRVFITDHNHGRYDEKNGLSSPDIPPQQRPLISAPVIIEDRVWIGENVCIMPGVRIGTGAIVGAGAVVICDLPPDSISVGIPARVIKRYDREKGEWVSV